jgi:ABC-type branched-subunit amino acid transport system ATPase component
MASIWARSTAARCMCFFTAASKAACALSMAPCLRARFLRLGRLLLGLLALATQVLPFVCLMGEPQLLLLDEPSLGLAPLLVAEILRTVGELRATGMTILLVEQNARAALAIADKGYVIETGRIVKSGTGDELLESDDVKRPISGCRIAVPAVGKSAFGAKRPLN